MCVGCESQKAIELAEIEQIYLAAFPLRSVVWQSCGEGVCILGVGGD